MPSGDAFALSLEALNANKVVNFYFHRRTFFVAAAEHHLDARVRLVGQEEKFVLGVVAKERLLALRALHRETFDVSKLVVVGIAHHGTPHFILVPLLNQFQVVFVMVVHIEVREVELAVTQHHKYRVVLVKLAQQSAVVVVIDAFHVGVEPHFTAAQCAVSRFEQTYFLHRTFANDVSTRGSRLDNHLREVEVHDTFFAAWGCFRFENNPYRLGLAVGIGREINHFRTRSALRKVVLAVARYAGDVETLDKIMAFLAVAIHNIISGAPVVALMHLHMQHVFAHKNLVGHAHYLILAVAMEHQDVVDVRAIAHKLVFFQPRSDKSLAAIDI